MCNKLTKIFYSQIYMTQEPTGNIRPVYERCFFCKRHERMLKTLTSPPCSTLVPTVTYS